MTDGEMRTEFKEIKAELNAGAKLFAIVMMLIVFSIFVNVYSCMDNTTKTTNITNITNIKTIGAK